MHEERRILIVDTDRATLFALTEAIRLRLGILSIDTAGSAGMAATLTASVHYHIIICICDMHMPTDEDLDAFSQARQFLPRPKVILHGGGKVKEQCPESLKCLESLRGGDGVLEKPIDLERFLAVVQAAWRDGGGHYAEDRSNHAAEHQAALIA